MRQLFTLILISFSLLSCKKKEPSSISIGENNSMGTYLVIVVSDSIEYGVEYNIPGPLVSIFGINDTVIWQPTLADSVPVTMTTYTYFDTDSLQFIDQNSIGCQGYYLATFNSKSAFPHYVIDSTFVFTGYSHLSQEDIHFIPKSEFVYTNKSNELDDNQVYSIFSDKSDWESGWELIKCLKIVYQYRLVDQDSKIGYMKQVNVQGKIRRYFFLAKTSSFNLFG